MQSHLLSWHFNVDSRQSDHANAEYGNADNKGVEFSSRKSAHPLSGINSACLHMCTKYWHLLISFEFLHLAWRNFAKKKVSSFVTKNYRKRDPVRPNHYLAPCNFSWRISKLFLGNFRHARCKNLNEMSKCMTCLLGANHIDKRRCQPLQHSILNNSIQRGRSILLAPRDRWVDHSWHFCYVFK